MNANDIKRLLALKMKIQQMEVELQGHREKWQYHATKVRELAQDRNKAVAKLIEEIK